MHGQCYRASNTVQTGAVYFKCERLNFYFKLLKLRNAVEL